MIDKLKRVIYGIHPNILLSMSVVLLVIVFSVMFGLFLYFTIDDLSQAIRLALTLCVICLFITSLSIRQ